MACGLSVLATAVSNITATQFSATQFSATQFNAMPHHTTLVAAQ